MGHPVCSFSRSYILSLHSLAMDGPTRAVAGHKKVDLRASRQDGDRLYLYKILYFIADCAGKVQIVAIRFGSLAVGIF